MFDSTGKITNAATTGPAQAPLPASSIPATLRVLVFQSSSSKDRSGEGGMLRIGLFFLVIHPFFCIAPDGEQIGSHNERILEYIET